MAEGPVVVIGGGIIGISTAYFLARAGAAVTVIEKGVVGAGSSYGNAGLICPCHSMPLAAPGVLAQGLRWLLDGESPFYIKPRLNLELLRWLRVFRAHCNQAAVETAVPLLRDLQRASLDLYREVIEREQLACDFEQRGGLALFSSEKGFERGRHEVEEMRRLGLKMRLLDGPAARTLEPAIQRDIAGAVYYEEDAFLTPHLFLEGLAKAARDYGAVILTETEAAGFEIDGQRVSAVLTSQGKMAVGQVVLAAGVWSTRLARASGLKLLMQPGKGYSVTVQRGQNVPRRYLYLDEERVAVTPMGDKVRYAGTMELAGIDASINQRRVQAIIRAAESYLGVGGAEKPPEIWSGMRPCSPDGLPYIGRIKQLGNLLVGTGHAMLGMSLGPVTGKMLAELVLEKRPTIELSPFAVDRFD